MSYPARHFNEKIFKCWKWVGSWSL